MTGEEIEHAIGFLLKNRADFDARFEAEREQTNRQIRQLAEGQQQTKEFLTELGQIVAQNTRDIAQNTQQINHLSVVLTNIAECKTAIMKSLTLCSNSSAG